MIYNDYNSDSKLFPNQATAGRDKSLYPKKERMLIGTAGYTERKCDCDPDVETPVSDIDIIVNQVVEILKNDGVFENMVVDEIKIANNVIQYLQDNDLLNQVDIDDVSTAVINKIKNDNLFVGPKGDPGEDGKDGADGKDGEPGPKGDPGIDGKDADPQDVADILKVDSDFINSLKGEKGEKGDPGENGQNGADGEPGPKGDKGDPGENGADGKDGKDADPQDVADILKADTDFVDSLKGPKGDKGDPGENGADGKDGKDAESPSAEDVADILKEDTDFIDSLKGDKGDQGDPGQDGQDGADGNVDEALEKVRDEIKKGFQRVLNEGTEYGKFVLKADNIVPTKDWLYTMNGYEGDHSIDFDDEGYIPVKAGKIYALSCDTRIKSGDSNSMVAVDLYDVDSNKRVGVTPTTQQSGNRPSVLSDFYGGYTIYQPETDGRLAIKVIDVVGATGVYFFTVSLIELAQPVMTNVDVDNYVKQTGINNQDAPVGNVISFMGTEAPAHYLLCDGSEYNITDYQYLADHFIEAFGIANYFGGDGETTFKVPDLRGEFLRGTGINSHTGNGSGADVGVHQDATQQINLLRSDNGRLITGRSGASLYTANTDTNDGSTAAGCYSLPDQNASYDNMPGVYTSRPTNTSVLWCIKYEPTYFLKIGDGALDGASIEEIVDYLKENGYIVETIDPTKEEIINGLVDTLESTGYLKETATNDILIETTINKLITDNRIDPTEDVDSDGNQLGTYVDFISSIKAIVFSNIGSLANYQDTVSQLVTELGSYYTDTITSDEVNSLIQYLKDQNLIEYQSPTKKQEVKDFLIDSEIFDGEDLDVNNLIPIAIQKLKDEGLIGSAVNVQEVSNTVTGDLKDSGFLNGYAKESYVDKVVKDSYDQTVKDLEDHTEAMIQQIKDGYQNILDDDIGYFMGSVLPNGVFNIGDLTFSASRNPAIKKHKIEVDSDGYVCLEKGKLYLIYAGVMIQGTNSKDVAYNVAIRGGDPIGYMNWAEINSYSDMSTPDIFRPNEDCAISIRLGTANVKIYHYVLTVLEIKQPVFTNVNLSSYMDQVGPDSQDTPVGNIISFMGNTTPKHYLACDGSVYNITDYPELANHFINEFGAVNYFGGDGATTFAVPDLRGEFLRGTGTATRNTGTGADVGAHQNPTQHFEAASGATFTNVPKTTAVANMDKRTIKTGVVSMSGSANNNATYGNYTSRPTNTSVMWCIKYEATYAVHFDDASIYSEEERVVGTWKGKALYQKLISTEKGIFTTTGKHYLSVEIDSDIDFGYVSEALWIGSAGTNVDHVYCIPDQDTKVAFDIQNKRLQLSSDNSGVFLSSVRFEIVIRYTKK